MNFRMAWVGLVLASILSVSAGEKIPLADGKTFKGWNGDTNTIWRIEDGAFIGGSLKGKVPHNEFLCTDRQFTNFVLRLKFKIVGTNGFVNGGVQFRSQRVPNHFEASGYQADLGDPTWWGSLYDESRRNKLLVASDMKKVDAVLKRGDWNNYEIHCEGKHIQLSINGTQTVDYTEPEDAIPQFGIIGLQVHGGGETEACYKDITIEELNATPTENSNALSITASCDGMFQKGSSWRIDLSPDATAELVIKTFPEPTKRKVEVSKSKMEELKETLANERFFQLQAKYGDIVPDGSARTLDITRGSQHKVVKLNFLPNIQDPKLIAEAQRAIRVWSAVQSLIEDKRAVDFRESDKMFLEKK